MRARVWLLAAFALVAVSLPAVSDVGDADADCFAGCPRWQLAVRSPWQALRNPGFTVAYDAQMREPRWVAYRAHALPRRQAPMYRQGWFAADPRLDNAVGPFDYRGSGYDRGHLAPAFLLTALYGREAGVASYWMSNVTPQTAPFNRLLWQRLEEAEAHKIAKTEGELWVIAGPIFATSPARTAQGVAIPTRFFRIWLSRDGSGRPSVCAFVVPQDVKGDEALSQFVTPIDAIEASSGLDFFPELDAAVQEPMERLGPDAHWPLAAIDHWPARYGPKP